MLDNKGSETLEGDANKVGLLAMLAVLLHIRVDVVAQRHGFLQEQSISLRVVKKVSMTGQYLP